MKTLLLCALATILLLPSCAARRDAPAEAQAQLQSGLLMTPQSTIRVSPDYCDDTIIKMAAHVVPTPRQLQALRNEFIAFVHFGPNTFNAVEWGSGFESPSDFALETLDTDQWVRAMRDAGMTKVILTVKHHEGFVLWQSRYTTHGVMSSPFQNGQGDVLRDLAASARRYGLKLGVYISPANLYQIEFGYYGNESAHSWRTIPRPVEGRPFENPTTFEFYVDDYNEYFLNSLFELLTEYGEIHEVWFDGAHPRPVGNQQYNYGAWRELIRTLAPNAVIFGREDIRWCGNESGATRATEWSIVPFVENPNTKNTFFDMMDYDLGSRERIIRAVREEGARYLHFFPTEVNTSIREGWFYRDDTHQGVRNADDVFDMWERSVGGNSIFLLNVTPNRQGVLSHREVEVLEEVGRRIRETYDTDLFANAQGPPEVLDGNPNTFVLMNENNNREITITLPAPATFNRLVLQEAIATHSERIERHEVEAWIGNRWVGIAEATNIGYKRILRFPEITTDRVRIRVTESRLDGTISHVSAHFHQPRPPMLEFSRNRDGMVTIAPRQAQFHWKPHGENPAGNLNIGYEIFYTLDGTEPTRASNRYVEPIKVERKMLRAVSFHGDMKGSVHNQEFGILRQNWQVVDLSSERGNRRAANAFDTNLRSYWRTEDGDGPHFIAIDLGAEYTLNAMVYTPQIIHAHGMMERGILQISNDGETWQTVETFEFGNLINDPTPRTHRFGSPVTARFVRVEATAIAAQGNSLTIAELDFL